jgi:aminopeptidase
MEKWAKALVGFSVEVEPGHTVVIRGDTPAEPLMRAVYREVLARGGYPTMTPTFPGLLVDLMMGASDEQLAYISPIERFYREEADVSVLILADTNTRAMSGVDPQKQVDWQKARAPLFKRFMERESAGEVQWTLTLYPTDAYAQEAEMSTDDYADFVYKACKLDADDPIAAWKEQAAEQQRLVDWLSAKREIHLLGPDTDLKVAVDGRKWINADGRKNFPDGEVFTGPVENGTNGHIRFNLPAITAGREVDGIRLRFESGKVVDASATKGEDYLIKQLDVDEGARFLGEFAFGTNFGVTKFTREILFDEKIGGTVHMAIGAGYPETGSKNESAVHWDMISDFRQGGTVTADGEPFLVDGKFVV